ncbi:MAG: isochorismate synthase [Candidatus Zixiibacteriota bacterium]
MNQFTDTIESVDLREAVRLLQEKISSLKHPAVSDNGIHRVTVDISADFPLFDWLKSTVNDSRLYWSDRDGRYEMAGIGEALTLASKSYLDVESIIDSAARLVRQSADGVRVFGGIRFPSIWKNGTSSIWQPFGDCRLVVPRFEIVKSKSQTLLVCNLTKTDFANLNAILRELDINFKESIGGPATSVDIISRVDLPDYEGWETTIKSIIRDFSKGEIEKIVLARQTTIHFKKDGDALGILKRLSAATPTCYHFFFQPIKDISFLGASPEQLYSRRGREITSEALAGTKSRGQDQASDQKLGQELLRSEKERREHKYVVDNIKEAMNSLCENYSAKDSPSLLKLPQVQHLRTEFKGKLRPGIVDADILKALHPTSAVGGFPSAAAQSRIAECEEFDRGWYAGAVGWLGQDAAEMAVAIRSGLVNGRQLILHSGAGIISGSTAQSEWAEIESKIESFLNAVGG